MAIKLRPSIWWKAPEGVLLLKTLISEHHTSVEARLQTRVVISSHHSASDLMGAYTSVGMIDPRTGPLPPAHMSARRTSDSNALEPLLTMCREGRTYDVERWIGDGRPLQIDKISGQGRRKNVTALEIALRRGNYALVHLLLCNGYDPNHELHQALDVALEVRRTDLAKLLLEWGVDRHDFDPPTLFATYDRPFFEYCYLSGANLARGHALAEALGFTASNKPLFGFVKRYAPGDPALQYELDIALAYHAGQGREKGVLLCLWAGGNPRAPVEPLEYIHDEPYDEEEAAYRETAVQTAAEGGHAKILARFRPDPSLDDYRRILRCAPSREVVEIMAPTKFPEDMTELVRTYLMFGGFLFRRSHEDLYGGLESLFERGARWSEASQVELRSLRRSILDSDDRAFVRFVQVIGTSDYVAPAIRHELARTPAFRKRWDEAGLRPRAMRWVDEEKREDLRALQAAFSIGPAIPPADRKKGRR